MLWLDVLRSPRRAFLAAADGQQSLRPFFWLLFLELLLLYPLTFASAAMRLPSTPLPALLSVWSAFVSHALPIAVGAALPALVLFYVLRLRGQRGNEGQAQGGEQGFHRASAKNQDRIESRARGVNRCHSADGPHPNPPPQAGEGAERRASSHRRGDDVRPLSVCGETAKAGAPPSHLHGDVAQMRCLLLAERSRLRVSRARRSGTLSPPPRAGEGWVGACNAAALPYPRRRTGIPLAGKLATSCPPSRIGAPGAGAQAIAVITSQLAGSRPSGPRSGS